MDAENFTYRHNGRNWSTLLAVTSVWFVLIAAVITVQASLWIVAVLGAFTLPALWDLYRNPASGLSFTQDALTWFTGKRTGTIAWREIDRVRLDTRLDFSVRATAVLQSGRKIRLPYESTPPNEVLEAALNARGIRTERHHFSLIG